MTLAEHKALVARYFEQVLTNGDVAALDDLLARDFRSWLPDGTSVGPGRYRDAVLASRQAFPDLAVTVLDQVAEGDMVATRWRARGTHRGVFAGVPATGRPVTITAIHLHRVAGGRLAEHWEAINLLPLLRQLGATG
ncbi:MAG TPA: ester cyclase [Actinomycetes bacterium]